jgi:hypothetical protein
MRLLLIFLISFSSFASINFSSQRIWKISDKKRNIYLDKGIIYLNSKAEKVSLKSIRSRFNSSKGYERIVLDFDTNNPPRIYGLISQGKKKLFIDLFNTTIGTSDRMIKKTKFVSSIDVYQLDTNKLSLELNLRKSYNFDVFYLSNPSRLVIDIKK